jgi:hypothetical protein
MLTVLARVVLEVIILSMNARLASDSVVNVLRPMSSVESVLPFVIFALVSSQLGLIMILVPLARGHGENV